MVNLLRRRRRWFFAIAIILVLLFDRVVFFVVVGWCSWRRGCGGVVMAGLSTAVPLTLLGTATNVAVVDR